MNVDRNKINYLTLIVGKFYGLPMSLIGLGFVILAVENIVVIPLLKPLNTARNYYLSDLVFLFTSLLTIIVLPILAMVVRKHYIQKFGDASGGENVGTLAKSIFWFTIFISLFLGPWTDLTYLPPVSATFFLISAGLILNWFFVTRGGGQIDLGLGVLVGILALTPLPGIISPEGFYLAPELHARDFFLSFAYLLWGSIFIFKGFSDYLFMNEMLKPDMAPDTAEEHDEFV